MGDIESVEALIKAINNFNGGLIIVTHDARLIREIDCDIWVVEDGTCYQFTKGFDGYRDKIIDQLEARQEEIERMEIKRQEERAKQRAKHVSQAKIEAAAREKKKQEAEAEAAAAVKQEATENKAA